MKNLPQSTFPERLYSTNRRPEIKKPLKTKEDQRPPNLRSSRFVAPRRGARARAGLPQLATYLTFYFAKFFPDVSSQLPEKHLSEVVENLRDENTNHYYAAYSATIRRESVVP
jgi:hypothetical protein